MCVYPDESLLLSQLAFLPEWLWFCGPRSNSSTPFHDHRDRQDACSLKAQSIFQCDSIYPSLRSSDLAASLNLALFYKETLNFPLLLEMLMGEENWPLSRSSGQASGLHSLPWGCVESPFALVTCSSQKVTSNLCGWPGSLGSESCHLIFHIQSEKCFKFNWIMRKAKCLLRSKLQTPPNPGQLRLSLAISMILD